MKKNTKTEEENEGAQGQRVKESDRRRRDVRGSDQEGRKVSQERIRAGSRL